MPARSDSCDSSEASGSDRFSTTVWSSGASTLATVASSLLRLLSGSVRARSRLALTAAALMGVPSWKTASVRSLKVSVLLSGPTDHDCASWGTNFRSGVMSTSRSHNEANTMRPTKVRARAGSSTSGSSCSPIRKVDWACANPVASIPAMAMARQSLRMKDLRRFRGGPCLVRGRTAWQGGTDPGSCRIAGPIPLVRTLLLDSAPGARRLYRPARGAPPTIRPWRPPCGRKPQGRRHGAEKSAEAATVSRSRATSGRASSRRYWNA